MKKKIIVIIPTYNEIENIQDIVEQVMSLPVSFDLMIIDDSSPDGTADKVKKLQQQFSKRIYLEIREEKQGLGTAYTHGFKKALDLGYDYIFEMDADLSHNPKDLLQLYKACHEEGYDVAIGSRYIKGVNVVNWPLERVLISYFASVYVKIVTGMPIKDPTAGFICYHKKVLKNLDLNKIKFVGYAFQIEMKYKAWKKGFCITEVPIIFTDRTKGKSKMSVAIFAEAALGVINLKMQRVKK